MPSNRTGHKKGILYRCLDFVEYVGNKLPHPATLFILFALAVIVLSAIFAAMEYVAIHPSPESKSSR